MDNEEIARRLDKIENLLFYGKNASDKDTADKIVEEVKKTGYVSWSKAFSNGVFDTGIWTRVKFTRLMQKLCQRYVWHTTIIGRHRMYYSDDCDMSVLKLALNKKLKPTDPEVMRIIKSECDNAKTERINILEITQKRFMQFSSDQQQEALWQFMRICEQNKDWGYKPERNDGNVFTGFVINKKGADEIGV